MDRSYTVKLLLIAAVLAMITFGLQLSGVAKVPMYNWFGLVYLVGVTLLIHAFVHAAKENPNSVIRRLMIASLMRMFFGILFLAITLLNVRPVNLHFVIFYCIYFCVFMLFEISQMRTNLRPDSKPRSKNENA